MPTGNELVKLSDLGTAFNIKLDKDFSGLTAANTFSSTDIIPIAVTVNNVTTTYKLTGATLATALAGIGNYLTTGDVVNNLTSTATDKPLSAAQGKALNTTLLGIMNDWEQMNNVTWKQTTFITKVALYQNHTVYMQMTLDSNNAASGDILAALPTNAKLRVFAPIVFADAATNAVGGNGLVYIEAGSKNIIVSRATVPANSYMNISMVIPVE